jgi:uncharacterized delta-60 repeat protein
MLQLGARKKNLLWGLLALGLLLVLTAFGTNPTFAVGQDGSVDPTFRSGSGFSGAAYALAIQSDGKIVVGGGFTTYNNNARHMLARLNPDGSSDTTLDPGTGDNGDVLAIAIQSDGKIVVGGGFTTYNGTTRNRIARLNLDGSLDTAFDPGSGANGDVNAIAIQSDGKVLIGGAFTTVGTSMRDRLARLENTVTKSSSSVAVTSSPNPSTVGQSATFTATVSPAAATGTVTFTIGLTDVTASLADGVATYVTPTLTPGDYPVVATYGGSAVYSGSVSTTYTHTVTKIATSVSVTSAPNPSLVGQSATFTATVTPNSATGTVTFTIGITDVTASVSGGGVATYVTNTLPVGSYAVTASYGGSAVYSGSVSSGQYTHMVDCNPLVVTSSTDNGTASSCGTFSYAVLSATSGVTITFAVTNVTFSGVLTPNLQAGVVLDGGANGVTLDGGTTLTGDGLVLGGNNRLIKLTIRGFNGRGLVVPPGKTNNKLDRVKVIKT